jgi:hypothetical protein
MKSLFVVLSASLFLLMSPAYATDSKPQKEATPAQKAQREKMKSCNKEATAQGLKKDERKAFMKECLSSKKADHAGEEGAIGDAAGKTAARDADKEKATACKAEAREKKLKGDARKDYVATCLQRAE